MSTLNDTTDGMEWATEFCRIFAGRMVWEQGKMGVSENVVDEGTMLAWFANAIEVGRTAGRQELCPHSWIIQMDSDLSTCRTCGKTNP